MFETGDVVLLPPEFGNKKKGVLVRKESNDVWLVQTGSTGYAFLPEKDLRPLTRMTNCGNCGLQFITRAFLGDEWMENMGKCPGCGASGKKRSKDQD